MDPLDLISGLLFNTFMAVLFLISISPLWLIFHYLTRWRSVRRLALEYEDKLTELWENAERVETRLRSLERILDAEVPGWRNRL